MGVVLASVMVSAGANSASTGILGFVGAVAGGVWGAATHEGCECDD